MNEEVENQAKEVLALVAKAPDYTDVSISEAFFYADSINSALAFLVGPKRKLEQAHNLNILRYIDNGDSKAAAEIRAKTKQAYLDWKRIEDVCDLAHEKILLLKKFKEDLEIEQQRA